MSTLNFNMIEKLYKNLPYVAREMINVLAIYGDPMRLEDMMRVLNLLKVKPSGKKRMTISSMEQPLTRLSRVGFIESEMLLYFTSKITPMLDVINYIAIKLEGEKKIEQYYAALVGAGLMIDILSLKRFSDKYKKHIQEKHHIYFRFLVLYNQYNRMLVIYKNISIKTEFDVIVTIYLDMFVKVSGGGHDWVYTREEPFVVCYILNKIPYMVSECKVLDQPLKKIDTLSSIDLAKLLSLPYANYIYIMIKLLLTFFHGDIQQLKAYLTDNSLDDIDLCLYSIIFNYYTNNNKKNTKHLKNLLKIIKHTRYDLHIYYYMLICFVIMTRFAGGRKTDIEFIRKLIKMIIYNDLPNSLRIFCTTSLLICDYLSGKQFEFESLHERVDALMSSELSIYTFFTSVLLYWLGQEDVLKKNNLLLQLRENARASHLWVLVREIDALLDRLKIQDKSLASDKDNLILNGINSKPFVDAFEPFPLWQLALKSLATYAPQEEESNAEEKKARRLIWLITVKDNQFARVELKEQKQTQAGTWSVGRRINPDKLLYSDYSDIATPHDIYIASVYNRYHNDRDYLYYVIKAMIDHPLIYLETPHKKRRHVKVQMGTPELLVISQQEGFYKLHIFPDKLDGETDKYILFGDDKITLYQLTPEQQNIIKICSAQVKIPENARGELESILKRLSHTIGIQSDLQIQYNDIKYIQSSAVPLVRLIPEGDDLLVKMYVRPFGSKGPLFLPGAGRANIVANIDGQRCYTCRNLRQEKENALQIIQNCQTLKTIPVEYAWTIHGPEASLAFLTELYHLQDKLIIEWPEGEKYRLAGSIKANNVRLKVRKAADWFEVSGEVHVNEELVMELSQLLSALRSSRQNFIMLDENRFLAITDELRKKLLTLEHLGDPDGDKQRLHPLALPVVKDILHGVDNIDADAAWSEYLQRLQKVEQTEVVVPEGLKARLRPYQKEGFAWLARLDQWGVGACLSDDMGLGKTVQTLAMIIYKAERGPSLVVAPTSVCYNWEEEINRFTPDLKPIFLGGYKDRKQIVKKLQPFDVLICSYGLIQRDDVVTLLKKQQWNIIVLDEAQHIKNPRTKRARAVNALKADFKIVTTGTPIENNLTDLWSIFRFINPGLLGSLKNFNTKFATPIEKYNDEIAANALKKLIQPFILRRTKAQVLKDLPPRTEITLKVELSEKERAFYEALRQEALSEINNMKGALEQNRMHIFAMLTRLRRACCHPKLITPELDIPSSKLATLNELLDELRANNHRVLIFSQFTGHLQLIRQMLQKKEITYQYLDGSTPSRKRQQAVEDFQAGQGDVFLISLKAGGTGLNLTAADYVIHMDPWWNPAVEDQASDRAHRIGQDKPVTIYRLVARDTIEEKIVELHSQKKDLAEKLLQGSDMSSKMKIEDVIALLRVACKK